jgi:hypothetical protein
MTEYLSVRTGIVLRLTLKENKVGCWEMNSSFCCFHLSEIIISTELSVVYILSIILAAVCSLLVIITLLPPPGIVEINIMW